jgi:protein O-mannosyl-transferase
MIVCMSDKKIILILLFLTSASLLAFWQVIHCDFINFDDDFYVTANSRVQNGITLEGIRWAFTTNQAANWHPLTWVSHMLDVQFFGLKPQWHHLTNLLLHIANTLLLFLVFHRMTKALWQSAVVAALFALHPLHVESVAWVAERKDVLSTFFWMLTMGAYLFYVERPGLQRYLAVLVFFALGLTAKPMLVTLPFVLLLMDYWPMRRFEQAPIAQEIRAEVNDTASADKRKRKGKKKLAVQSAARTVQVAAKKEQTAGPKRQWTMIRPLLWEKIPLFSLAALSSIVTYIVQQQGGAVKSIETSPLSVRIGNAFVAYTFYIVKTIWPSNLAVYYPHPGLWPLWQILVAVLLFIAATFLVIWRAKRFRYLASGWLWYVGTLVPVIGLVQVGDHARADRYTYIPLIGLFIIVAWGIPELLERWRCRKEVLVASSALSLLSFFVATWTQVGYWQDNVTLYNHTLRVTNQNFMILNNRGVAYDSLGNHTQAIADFDKAIAIKPRFAMAYTNRGSAYDSLGNFTRAIADFDKAIEIKPKDAKAYNNRAATYGRLNHYAQAIADFDKAIEIDPEFSMAYNNRGSAYGNLGNYTQAIADFNRAIEINPRNDGAFCNRGIAHGMLGNYRQAIEDFDRTVALNPKFAGAYYYRSIAHDKLGNQSQALDDLKTAARLGSRDAKDFLSSNKIDWQ